MRMSAAMLVLIAVAPLPVAATEVEFDKKADFSAYQTYAWSAGREAKRADVQETITTAVEQELAGAGLAPVESDPDLYVATYVLVDSHSLEDLSKPDQWEYWTGVRSVDAYQVGAGTLVVDLIDAGTGGVVWRSLSSGTINGKLDRLKKRLPKTVRKMFLDYPPATP